jgi:NADPH:quinone reductase
MRAIVMYEPGGPEVLRLEDRPVPEPGPGEVVIRTEAIGASFTEAWLRSGAMPVPVELPAVFGVEAAGVVTQIGDGVGTGLAGRRVLTLNSGFGAYAEYVAAPAAGLAEIPAGIGAQEAVATGNWGAVALCALRAARLTGTETVLVETAAGGVGGYLTQLAHRLGARRVIGTAGSEAKRELARGFGADEVIDHYAPGWIAQLSDGSVDAVFESLGGDTTGQLVPKLTPGSGRVLLYGFLRGMPAFAATDFLFQGLTLTGCAGPAWLERVQAARAEVFELVAAGHLRPQIDSVLPLEDAVKAHQRFDDRAAAGKIVLTP